MDKKRIRKEVREKVCEPCRGILHGYIAGCLGKGQDACEYFIKELKKRGWKKEDGGDENWSKEGMLNLEGGKDERKM